MSVVGALKAFMGAGISKFAEGFWEPFKEAFYDELVEGAARALKLFMAEKLSLFRNMVTGTMASLQVAQPSGEWGYTPKGFEDVLVNMVTGSVMLSMLVGEELAEEFFAEMIQEGTSNAIQTSFGGYFQTLLNIFRGGSPLNPDDIREMYSVKDILDEKILAVNAASAGANYYATLYYLASGAMENIDRNMIAGVNQIQQLSLRAVEYGLFFQEYQVQLARRRITDKLNAAMENIDYWIQVAVDSIETAISRINDMINELETAIEDYQVEPRRIDDAALEGVVQSLANSFNKLKEVVDRILSKLQSLITSETLEISEDDINAYLNAVRNYALAIATLASILNGKYIELLQEVVNFLITMGEYIWAYRTYDPYATVAPPQQPTEATAVTPSYTLTIQVIEES